ncbi:hypothetical protein CFP56_012587 [Quercus suber]|uniref:Uncharacterized protein n=1 Tax=Quercus suber TaxID=58331 RepID=A0AAW0KVD9_QUESU
MDTPRGSSNPDRVVSFSAPLKAIVMIQQLHAYNPISVPGISENATSLDDGVSIPNGLELRGMMQEREGRGEGFDNEIVVGFGERDSEEAAMLLVEETQSICQQCQIAEGERYAPFQRGTSG